MGQKVNPIGFRLGVNQRWISNWYTDKGQKEFINEDAKIRRFLSEKVKTAGLSRTEITRAGKDDTGKNLQVTVYVGRPGMVFGRKGENLDKVKNSLRKYIKQEKLELHIKEVKRPETDAKLIAINVANQLEKRFSFRRVIKKALVLSYPFVRAILSTIQATTNHNFTACYARTTNLSILNCLFNHSTKGKSFF